MSDSLSHFFSHVKNAQKSRILVIEHPQSKVIISILDTLQDCGYIRGYRIQKKNTIFSDNFKNTKYSQKIEILLKYKNEKPVINEILRISKPSKRIYVSVKKFAHFSEKKNETCNINLSPLLFMKGIFILSTSKGIMSHITAFRLNIGGEVLCHIS